MVRRMSSRDLRNDDAERVNLIDAGVGGVEGARNCVEPDFARDLLLELAPQCSGLNDLEWFAGQEIQLYSEARVRPGSPVESGFSRARRLS